MLILMKMILMCAIAMCVLGNSNLANSAPILFNIEGTLGNSVYTYASNPPPPWNYPYPQLLGGSFTGSFSIDSNTSPTETNSLFNAYDYLSVDIKILDVLGNVVHTIDSGPNRLRVFHDGSRITTNFGESFGVFGLPEDLRIDFIGTFTTGSTPPLPFELLTSTFSYGFLDVDDSLWDGWEVDVTSAHIIPVPTSIVLLCAGMVIILLRGCRKHWNT